jgi:tetratricopeptide (TPR) repeat protein
MKEGYEEQETLREGGSPLTLETGSLFSLSPSQTVQLRKMVAQQAFSSSAEKQKTIDQLKLQARTSARNHLGNLYVSIGQLQKAANVLGKEPNVPPLQQRRFEQARKEAEASLRKPHLTPFDEVMARLTLAQIYLETGKIDEAEAEMSKMPKPAQRLWLVALLRTALNVEQDKNLGDAEKHVRQLLDDQPNNPRLQVALGEILAKLGDVKQGLVILEECAKTEVMARDLVFFDSLGNVYLQNHDTKKARKAWQTALGLFPKTTEPDDYRKKRIEEKLKRLKQ